jgi:hypothetical protein
MTEAEWLTRETLLDAPQFSPLSWLREPGDERRMFLFLAAYLPRLMSGQFCPACLQILPLFLRHADAGLTAADWQKALRDSHPRTGEAECATRPVFRRVIQYLRGIFCPAEFWNGLLQTYDEVEYQMRRQHWGDADRSWFQNHAAETDSVSRDGMRLLKDIAGNPYRPRTFDFEWRTDTVLALARQMYESRDFSTMPILADALQDAGCDNASVLEHCRLPGDHVRGCWVVDALLGKE